MTPRFQLPYSPDDLSLQGFSRFWSTVFPAAPGGASSGSRGAQRPEMPLFLLAARPFPRRWPTWLAPIAAVEYLEAAPAFASNHGLGMAIAQLDLTNWPARCVDLQENYRRVGRRASWRSARRRVSASPDLNGRRDGIEIRLEHRLVSITIPLCGRAAVHSRHVCGELLIFPESAIRHTHLRR